MNMTYCTAASFCNSRCLKCTQNITQKPAVDSLPFMGLPTIEAIPWKKSRSPKPLDIFLTPINSQITIERNAINAAVRQQ